jgi:hypothetical protein
MKPIIFPVLMALVSPSSAMGQTRPTDGVIIAETNSTMLVKMTSSVNSSTSKVGDLVTGTLIDPRNLRGDIVEGRVTRADHAIIAFSFDRLRHNGKVYPFQSQIISVTSSKGNEGRDDLDNRVRIEGVGVIAFGNVTAFNEGAEIRITAFKK